MASEANKSKYGKKYRAALKNLDQEKYYDLSEAVKALVENKVAKFDETLDIVLELGVDTKHSDQMVRGVISMPNGTGKTVRVAVFARDAKADEARKAGADIVGAEDLVDQILKGDINFDVCIATPDMMGLVGRVAKVLGPKGIMPNPKLGTVTPDVSKAVAVKKAGQVEYRAEKEGIVHAGLGKVSFSVDALVENIKVFVDAVVKAKPAASKGKYLKQAYLSTTMGPSVKLDLVSLEASLT